jgi:hypothetical protein
VVAALLIGVAGDLGARAASKPGKVKLSKVTADGSRIIVKFKKISNADGYQISVSTSSKFKKAENYTLEQGKKSTITYTTSELNSGKYYVRVRAYKSDGSKNVYGSWSAKKKVTLKATASVDVIEADFLNAYEDLGNANGGIIPVKKDGLWGTVDYNGKKVTPCLYNIFWYAPDNNGRTVFKNSDGTYYLVDKKGKVVYSGKDEVMSSGGYYIVNRQTDDDEFEEAVPIASQDYYDASGKLVVSNEINGDSARLNGFIDGVSTSKKYRTETGVDGYYYGFLNFVNVTSSGKTKAVKNSNWDENNKHSDEEMNIDHTQLHGGGGGTGGSGERYTLGSENGGYYLTNGPVTTDISIWNSKGEFIGMLPQFTNEENDFSYSWPQAFFIDGSWQFNLGSLIAVKKINFMEDLISQCVLVDASKLGSNGSNYIESLPKKAVLYTGAYVGINTEKYWLATKDYSTWDYIDHSGKVVKTYEDATDFFNGYAVVKENGKGYLIDENFNVIKELGKIEGAYCYSSVFKIEKNDGSFKFYIVNKTEEGKENKSEAFSLDSNGVFIVDTELFGATPEEVEKKIGQDIPDPVKWEYDGPNLEVSWLDGYNGINIGLFFQKGKLKWCAYSPEGLYWDNKLWQNAQKLYGKGYKDGDYAYIMIGKNKYDIVAYSYETESGETRNVLRQSVYASDFIGN